MHNGKRILLFTRRPEDWQPLLARPERQWRRCYSARTLAHCWEAANGFPEEIELAFAQSTEPELVNLTPLLAIPEFKVPLPPLGRRASQNDIFVLARSLCGQPVTIMVEGKVDESFGQTLQQWKQDIEAGKEERLRFLLRILGQVKPHGGIRYQLLHRAASAIITGEQYRAMASVLLIHSFSRNQTGWGDYQAFTRDVFKIEAKMGSIQKLTSASRIPLLGLWVEGNRCYLNC